MMHLNLLQNHAHGHSLDPVHQMVRENYPSYRGQRIGRRARAVPVSRDGGQHARSAGRPRLVRHSITEWDSGGATSAALMCSPVNRVMAHTFSSATAVSVCRFVLPDLLNSIRYLELLSEP